MFVSIIFLIIIALIFMFVAVWNKARNIKQKHILDAEKRGDIKEVERLKNLSDDQAADEFEDELSK